MKKHLLFFSICSLMFFACSSDDVPGNPDPVNENPKDSIVVTPTDSVSVPNPESDGVLFSDSFESGDLSGSENGITWEGQVSTYVTTDNANSDTHSLAFKFSAKPDGEDSFSEQRFKLGAYYTDIWISYDLFIPENYYHRSQSESTNNKGYLYLWSGDYGNPDGPGMGPNLWPNGDGSSNHSFYMWGPGLDKHIWDAAPESILLSDRGQWIKIVCHYKYATAAANDGVAEIWKVYSDDTVTKIQDIQNGSWYVKGQQGFTTGYLLGWANSGFDEETIFYVDNFVVSTEPLME